MPTPTPTEAPAAGGDDLSALAWVQAELRRSLESAHKALRRYVRESEGVAQSDVDAVDPAVLRSARVQIHQGVGALELVGLPAVATALRAGEAAVQRMATRPKLATMAAVETLEQLSRAVIDFLGRRLAGKDIAPLALFPQYAAAQALAGAERVHPADLWAHDWQWHSLPRDPQAVPRQPDDDTRGEIEYLTLALMRVADPAAQRRMSDLCAGLGAGTSGELATLWQLAAAYFEAQAAGLVAADLHTKRVGSRLLASLRAAARGQRDVPERLAQDLLFYGVRAPLPDDASALPRLAALQSVWPGDPSARGDYQQPRLGLFDPAVVQQARKRVAGAKDAWSAVCGGELQRLAGLGESFTLLADSVQRLFADGESLGQALQAAAAQAAAASRAPGPEQAMEVATAILYLDAALEDGELDAPVLRERVQHLAQRITDVGAGAEAQPLEQWMEDLYRRVSDRQTMGSVVQELRASLSVVEKQIDQYFRDPSQRELLIPVPAQLSTMRGVLSVLGMDQASHAVLRMRDDIDALAETEVDPQRAIQTGTFDRLADNLGALSFLIDMLSVQPVLAKTLFRFDPETGNLSAVMRQSERVSAFAAFDTLPPSPAPAEAVPASAASPTPAPPASGLEDDAEMREIFLEEAGEVIADARASMARLVQPGGDLLAEMTNIRRAFHTLKGSSRMVGLKPFGEAAWACEQLYNARLAQNAQMDGPLHRFTGEALDYLAGWVDAIAAGTDAGHAPDAVTAAADALRVEGRHQPLPLPGAVAPPEVDRTGVAPLAAASGIPPGPSPEPGLMAPAGVPAAPTAVPSTGSTVAPASEPVAEGAPAPATGRDPAPGFEPESAADGQTDFVLPDADALPGLQARVPDLPSADDLTLPPLDLDEPGLAAPAPDTGTAAEPKEPAASAEAWARFEPAEPAEPPETPAVGAPTEPPPAVEPTPAAPPLPDFELDLGAFDAPAAPAPAPPDLPLQPIDEELDQSPPEAPTQPESVGEPEVLELSAADFDLEFSDAVEPAAEPDAAAGPAEVAPVDVETPAGEPVDSGLAPTGLPDVDLPFVEPLDLDLPAVEPPDLDLPATEGAAGSGASEPLADAAPAPAPPADERPQDTAEPATAAHEPPLSPPEEASGMPPETTTGTLPETFTETPADAGGDDTVKVVGDLRIAIPLFNIFLNEADEQSRRLGTEIAEWVLEPERAMGEAAIALAHSLAGNSGTVGFTDLSMLARAFEHALMRSRDVGHASDGESELFTDAAAEIRRLLHQFAAGFLKPVDAALMLRLADHEIATSNPERDTESPELDDSMAGDLGPPSLPLPTEPLPPSDALEDTDDLDAVDALDRDLFPIFEEEADELLPQLRGRLADWVRQPADAGAPAACMRTLHTFKGGARLAGAMRVGELAHRLESDIERLSAQDAVAVADVEQLLGKADAMAALFDRLRRHPAPPPPPAVPSAAAQPLPLPLPMPMQEPDREPAREPSTPAADALPAAPPDAAPAAGVEDTAVQGPPTPDTAPPIDWRRFAAPAGAPVLPRVEDEAAPAPGSGNATVRVRAPLLDRLVNQAGEVSITRARIESAMHTLQGSLGDLTENLDKLRRHLRDLELQAETQISARIEAAKTAAEGFDPLEMDRFTRFQEVTRMMAESVNDVATVQRGLQRALQTSEDELAAQARLTRDLQDDLLRTRMVEFESLADRLYRVVRQAAKETGKAVRLDLEGGSIEVDRGVLERMVGPFEHLLRNCVAHGIEPADRRRAAGKPEAGTITIATHQEGNEIGVEVRDDGGGLDLERIRARAIERGLLAPDVLPSDDELAQLIFLPGFSTVDNVSGLAGRGVGMDVVRSEVNAMGGRIETVNRSGQGTSFRLLLPLTTAVTQVVMLRFGDRQVAVPSTLVEVVRRAKADEVERCYASGAYALDGVEIPFYWLGALLQASGRGGNAERSQTVVVLRSASQRVAVHVDEVVGNQEVVVKNVGPQLSHLPGLAGITLLPSGAVAMIYNPVALGTVYGDEARALMRARPAPEAPLAVVAPVALRPLILVVDDSLTVRRVTQRLLLREGYRVALAKDGMDALEQLASERPALLLSDIEMPRMDGFDLVRNLRSDPRWSHLPVIMITSRIAPKHREYAAELGVQHYLGKPYAEDELLALVAQHVTADIPL